MPVFISISGYLFYYTIIEKNSNILLMDPVNEAEYPFLVNVTHPCAFAILVDDFYDASQFLDNRFVRSYPSLFLMQR